MSAILLIISDTPYPVTVISTLKYIFSCQLISFKRIDPGKQNRIILLIIKVSGGEVLIPRQPEPVRFSIVRKEDESMRI
jgi:hypothetical protein